MAKRNKKRTKHIIKRKAVNKKTKKERKVIPKRIKFQKKAKPKKAQKPKSLKSIPKKEVLHKTKFRIIAIGGGAGSIISEIKGKVKRVDFVAANSDLRALKELSKGIRKLQFGQSITGGLGTGMNSQIGEGAALQDKEKIKKIFTGQDFCVIIACLGGGISSGATPIFAKMAREAGAITYGIFTLPFDFEGEKKKELAIESLKKIKPYFNAYSLIPNERIFQIIDRNTPLRAALSSINKKLAENLEGLIEMICLPGMINIDFADLRTILEGRGKLAYLDVSNTASQELKEELEEEKINGDQKKITSSAMYPYTIKGARGVLYNISGGKELQLDQVSQISKEISDSVSKDAKIIFGISQNKEQKTKITIFAVGCPIKNFLNPEKKEPQKKERLKKEPPKIEINKKIKKKNIKEKNIKIANKSHKKNNKPIKKPVVKKENRTAPAQKTEFNIKIKKPEIKLTNAVFSYQGNLKTETNIRRNALELRKAIQEEEKKLLEQEKIWDPPAIFRKKQIKSN